MGGRSVQSSRLTKFSGTSTMHGSKGWGRDGAEALQLVCMTAWGLLCRFIEETQANNNSLFLALLLPWVDNRSATLHSHCSIRCFLHKICRIFGESLKCLLVTEGKTI